MTNREQAGRGLWNIAMGIVVTVTQITYAQTAPPHPLGVTILNIILIFVGMWFIRDGCITLGQIWPDE